MKQDLDQRREEHRLESSGVSSVLFLIIMRFRELSILQPLEVLPFTSLTPLMAFDPWSLVLLLLVHCEMPDREWQEWRYNSLGAITETRTTQQHADAGDGPSVRLLSSPSD